MPPCQPARWAPRACWRGTSRDAGRAAAFAGLRIPRDLAAYAVSLREFLDAEVPGEAAGLRGAPAPAERLPRGEAMCAKRRVDEAGRDFARGRRIRCRERRLDHQLARLGHVAIREVRARE